MARRLELHTDRLFPAEPTVRSIARELYAQVAACPIVSPHGHCDPAWFADNDPFSDPTSLLVRPDHYLTRMLYSQGVALTSLGISATGRDDELGPGAARAAWQVFAQHYDLFRGTPSRIWLDQTFIDLFGLDVVLDGETADHYFDVISDALTRDEYRPRSLFESFNIEVLATTESPLDDLDGHKRLGAEGWGNRVITTFRPDPVVNPAHDGFVENVAALGTLTHRDTGRWDDYLASLWERRQVFRSFGATATDHGHPAATTADLSAEKCQQLLTGALSGHLDDREADLFRGQVLTEMAAMSLEDGLVMQIHAGSRRDHNPLVHRLYGRDRGADIPGPTDYVESLRPLLNRFGNDSRLTVILFTLDESAYSRELAPLAGHYPCLLLGPPWWFFDSVEGIRRYRRAVTETAGYANTAGFNDDTRAFLSIPARHDLARRVECGELAYLVSEHRLTLEDASELAEDCAHRLARRAYRLGVR
ncbi:MAG TPA: glucuronate isomerase [Acidimicrobiales bacterium]|nr:glucuronate isomerase [Acidimicrobiales bacterium]